MGQNRHIEFQCNVTSLRYIDLDLRPSL